MVKKTAQRLFPAIGCPEWDPLSFNPQIRSLPMRRTVYSRVSCKWELAIFDIIVNYIGARSTVSA